MKKIKAIAIITALVITICGVFCGCEEDDGKGYVFGYDISANPDSLDPQCAENEQSSLVIGCIFQGLVKTDSKGNIKEAGALSYSVSDDGLTYVFSLNRESRWTDVNDFDEPCTAHDYVYGLRRLFLPETRSSKAPEFYCIKNAEKINKGIITDVSQLGVRAEGDYKLVIELEYPKSDFLLLLTTPAAMPCNEKYFLKSQGKYGLSAATTPSNGAFFVKSWNYDYWSSGSEHNNMVLRYNASYNKLIDEVYPLGLNFFIEDSDKHEKDFQDGTSQNILLTGKTAQRYADKGFSYQEYSTDMCGIIMNTQSSIFSSERLRLALMYASDTSGLSLPFGFSGVNGAVPQSVGYNGVNYREYTGTDKFTKPDNSKAAATYKKAVESIKREDINSVKILAMQNRDEDIGDAVQALMQQWQATLGFYCSLVYLPESEYNEAIANGEYSLAVARYSGEYNSPLSYLRCFTKSGFSYTAMGNEYNQLLSKASLAVTAEECASYCLKAERLLMTDGRFIPLAVISEYFFSAEDCYDIYYNPFSKGIDYIKSICIE